MSTLVIAQRFCGPPGMGNGGYTAGRVASVLDGPAEVTLRAPAPLDTVLVHNLHGDLAQLSTPEGGLIAEARPLAFELEVPPSVSFDAARHASEAFLGFFDHPYPGCFVCGTQRSPEQGAGLSLFPGAVVQSVSATPVVATPFVPARDLCNEQGLLRDEFVWAALDCPSWFGHAAFSERVEKILLGRLAVRVERRPAHGERCVVQGWSLGREGRRTQCGSALYAADGACLAYARATWVELKPS